MWIRIWIPRKLFSIYTMANYRSVAEVCSWNFFMTYNYFCWFRLSLPGCLTLAVLSVSWQSFLVCALKTVLSQISCLRCPAKDVLSRMSWHASSGLAVLSSLSCHGYSVTTILVRLSCPPWLSFHGCSVLHLINLYFDCWFLSFHSCPFMAVLSSLSCQRRRRCLFRAFLSWLCHPGSLVSGLYMKTPPSLRYFWQNQTFSWT
jgi:hypothetical protein